MHRLNILDCTLRDGGYCNKWTFGENNIKKIVSGLAASGVEIVELGFLTNKVEFDANISKVPKLDCFKAYLEGIEKKPLTVAMINYGEYAVENLPDAKDSPIDGLRVAFHKNKADSALEFCRQIKAKGYKVFVQAMVSLNYSDTEFIDLIKKVNEISPYAFYIVDSFGMMKRKDLARLFYIVEHNLNEDIWIGFHSHNNLQLAYSNAQFLADTQTNRDIIIDSSIYGMGRGAGNLNTELFADYLNGAFDKDYNIRPLLNVIDEVLNKFYKENYWGYSLPNYLSALYNIHPNYAGYLSDKNTLTLEDMDEIFARIDRLRAVEYDKNYVEQLYVEYLSEKNKVDKSWQKALEGEFKNKKILILAPGRSFRVEADKINKYISENKDLVIISVNFDGEPIKADYIFVSNLRRYKDLKKISKVIGTSNITSNDLDYTVPYDLLRNDTEMASDNVGLMAINLMIRFGAKEVAIAGIDGYSINQKDNYQSEELDFHEKDEVLLSKNRDIKIIMEEYKKLIPITFITTSMFG